MAGRVVYWKSMVEMIDAVLDIAMMRRCHSRIAGRKNPTAEYAELLEKSLQKRFQRVIA
jgi:hypothetical protein